MSLSVFVWVIKQTTEYELTFDDVYQGFVNEHCCVSNRPNPQAVPFSSREPQPANTVPAAGPDVIIQGGPPNGFATDFIRISC